MTYYKKEDLIQVPGGKVSGNPMGRLGNQMFATVAAMTYADRTSREFVGMAKSWPDDDYQKMINKTVMKNVKWIDYDIVSEWPTIDTGPFQCDGFPNTSDKNVYLNDYYQDLRCIDKEIAFSLFKPYDSILKTVYELYPNINDVVCFHVRRGDYLDISVFNHFDKEEILDIIKKYFRRDKIMFVSDDIKWCMDNFTGSKYCFADKEYEYPVELDLYLQTQSKANVISNSTFSWWGAYLNERTEKVVYHWPWFNMGIDGHMDTIAPDNWIKHIKS